MSPTALALIAAAAVAHASWNFFAKQARGGLPFVWLAGLCAATIGPNSDAMRKKPGGP